ncbi:hypothetical protein ABVK25_011562 [Lepraria finkii]|uniref:Uncharacterized protein n=1 Tax=Lepraria finkii TaxID=1340010 RepID=A0ABR4ALX0_9LECA
MLSPPASPGHKSTAKAISQSSVPAPGAAGDDGTSSFTHTKVVVQKSKRFYNAYTSHPLWNAIDKIETSFLDVDLFPILLSEYCPPPPADVLLAPDQVLDSYYEKKFKPSDQGSQPALQEIETWSDCGATQVTELLHIIALSSNKVTSSLCVSRNIPRLLWKGSITISENSIIQDSSMRFEKGLMTSTVKTWSTMISTLPTS